MSDKPLQTKAEREHRIRERAYHLWEDAGRPPGRAEEYWERAERLIGIEDSSATGQLTNPPTQPTPAAGAPVEQAKARGNHAASPDRLTGSGNRPETPRAKTAARKGKVKPAGGGVPGF